MDVKKTYMYRCRHSKCFIFCKIGHSIAVLLTGTPMGWESHPCLLYLCISAKNHKTQAFASICNYRKQLMFLPIKDSQSRNQLAGRFTKCDQCDQKYSKCPTMNLLSKLMKICMTKGMFTVGIDVLCNFLTILIFFIAKYFFLVYFEKTLSISILSSVTL